MGLWRCFIIRHITRQFHRDGIAIRYRCFRVLPDDGYCVQSADYYPEAKASAEGFERQFIELFTEQEPDDRSGIFPTLEEAILDFDKGFGSSS